MVKKQLTVTIEEEVLSNIWKYKKSIYPGLSKSAMIEILLRDAMDSRRKDMSIAR